MLKGKKETLTHAGGGGGNQIYATQVNLSVPSIVALRIEEFSVDLTFHLQGETQEYDLEVIGLTADETLALFVLDREQSSRT